MSKQEPLMSNDLSALTEGMHFGEDGEGRMIIVFRGKPGEGWTVKHELETGWLECVDYDETGNQQCVYYEK